MNVTIAFAIFPLDFESLASTMLRLQFSQTK